MIKRANIVLSCLMTFNLGASVDSTVQPTYPTVEMLNRIANPRDTEGVLSLLSQGADVNVRFGDNLETPLMLAIRQLVATSVERQEWAKKSWNYLGHSIKYGFIIFVLYINQENLKDYKNIIDFLHVVVGSLAVFDVLAWYVQFALGVEVFTQQAQMKLITFLINHNTTNVLITNKHGQTALDVVQSFFAQQATGEKDYTRVLKSLRILEELLIKRMELQHKIVQDGSQANT